MGMFSEDFKLFRGVVENNKDPEKRGRVQVRVLGEDTMDLEKVPTTDLVWAEVMMPATWGGISGVGISSVLLQGTWVWLFYEDPGNKSLPVVLGVSPKIHTVQNEGAAADPDKKYPIKDRLNEPDFNRSGREDGSWSKTEHFTTLTNKKQGPCPTPGGVFEETIPTNQDTKYPYNNIIETQCGHTIQVDDTPGKEQIEIFHKCGSYIHINNEGNITVKSIKKVEQFAQSDNFNIYANKDYNLSVGSNYYVGAGESAKIKYGTTMDLNTGGEANHTYGGDLFVKSPMIHLN